MDWQLKAFLGVLAACTPCPVCGSTSHAVYVFEENEDEEGSAVYECEDCEVTW